MLLSKKASWCLHWVEFPHIVKQLSFFIFIIIIKQINLLWPCTILFCRFSGKELSIFKQSSECTSFEHVGFMYTFDDSDSSDTVKSIMSPEPSKLLPTCSVWPQGAASVDFEVVPDNEWIVAKLDERLFSDFFHESPRPADILLCSSVSKWSRPAPIWSLNNNTAVQMTNFGVFTTIN